jgi:hypothetical protein
VSAGLAIALLLLAVPLIVGGAELVVYGDAPVED